MNGSGPKLLVGIVFFGIFSSLVILSFGCAFVCFGLLVMCVWCACMCVRLMYLYRYVHVCTLHAYVCVLCRVDTSERVLCMLLHELSSATKSFRFTYLKWILCTCPRLEVCSARCSTVYACAHAR